jgi:uncharacterized tellurite resistance protein B-like protein
MIRNLKQFFRKIDGNDTPGTRRAPEHDIRVATCALFVEMASIDEKFTPDEKIEIVETLWGMVYADGNMDRYEHYLMNKMKSLLRLSQKQVIEAKLRVLKDNDLS